MTCILIGFLMCTPQMPQQTFLATTSAYVCTLDEECINSAGKRAVIGDLACPRGIKLGTKVIMNGDTYTCNDHTALKWNGRYDIFFGYGDEAKDSAITYGLEVREISVINTP